jgi:hypothetical protein
VPSKSIPNVGIGYGSGHRGRGRRWSTRHPVGGPRRSRLVPESHLAKASTDRKTHPRRSRLYRRRGPGWRRQSRSRRWCRMESLRYPEQWRPLLSPPPSDRTQLWEPVPLPTNRSCIGSPGPKIGRNVGRSSVFPSTDAATIPRPAKGPVSGSTVTLPPTNPRDPMGCPIDRRSSAQDPQLRCRPVGRRPRPRTLIGAKEGLFLSNWSTTLKPARINSARNQRHRRCRRSARRLAQSRHQPLHRHHRTDAWPHPRRLLPSPSNRSESLWRPQVLVCSAWAATKSSSAGAP